MVFTLTHGHPLRRMFAGLTEHTFLSELGVAEPQVVDYLSDLLVRFVHRDAIYAVKNPRGKCLEQLAEMAAEADRPASKTERRREVFRHMGDYALFWSGVYPEVFHSRHSAERHDSIAGYFETGKRSYYMASTFADEPYSKEAPVLRRLSELFEVCAYGLHQVRAQWETADSPS